MKQWVLPSQSLESYRNTKGHSGGRQHCFMSKPHSWLLWVSQGAQGKGRELLPHLLGG